VTRRLRHVALVAGVLVALALTLLAVLAPAPEPDARPHPFNQDRNAVWLEARWLRRAQDEAEVESLIASLDRHGVRYLFPHLIPFSSAGRLPVDEREPMRAFLAVAHRVAPEMKILPWVGGLRVGYRRQRPGTIDLADLAQRQRLAAECRGLTDEGFDGVHLDIEPVDDGNSDFLALLRALRTAVGANHLLSLAAIRPGPIGLPFAPNFVWTPAYYARVAGLADQLVVMAYDTGLPSAGLYRRYVAWAAAASTRAVAGTRARLLFGVPTYEDWGLMHRAGVETPENALPSIVAGLRGVGAGGTVEGVALYAEWTTDAREWAVYETLWRGTGRFEVKPAPRLP